LNYRGNLKYTKFPKRSVGKWKDCEQMTPGTTSGDLFRCLQGKCIHSDGVCNGVQQCQDNSDENLLCPSRCYFHGRCWGSVWRAMYDEFLKCKRLHNDTYGTSFTPRGRFTHAVEFKEDRAAYDGFTGELITDDAKKDVEQILKPGQGGYPIGYSTCGAKGVSAIHDSHTCKGTVVYRPPPYNLTPWTGLTSDSSSYSPWACKPSINVGNEFFNLSKGKIIACLYNVKCDCKLGAETTEMGNCHAYYWTDGLSCSFERDNPLIYPGGSSNPSNNDGRPLFTKCRSDLYYWYYN
jgi:hypothetical protein